LIHFYKRGKLIRGHQVEALSELIRR